MKEMKNLFCLQKGQSAKIYKINTKGDLRRRLMDIGLRENSYVRCVLVSPPGDPKAFDICGALIALRKIDCMDILIEP
ncbi:MAG: ferrous iron transport protein A [Ruminococcaceae bacterium]|nr:ferrous iron transport protein A [Oscillospiraceae bacterium]